MQFPAVFSRQEKGLDNQPNHNFRMIPSIIMASISLVTLFPPNSVFAANQATQLETP